VFDVDVDVFALVLRRCSYRFARGHVHGRHHGGCVDCFSEFLCFYSVIYWFTRRSSCTTMPVCSELVQATRIKFESCR
jgi:hypothetical protein